MGISTLGCVYLLFLVNFRAQQIVKLKRDFRINNPEILRRQSGLAEGKAQLFVTNSTNTSFLTLLEKISAQQ